MKENGLFKCKTMDKNNREISEFKIDKKMRSKRTCSSFLKGLSGLSNY